MRYNAALMNMLNNERRDIPMLHDLQHQFAYNRSTERRAESPIHSLKRV